VQRWVKVTTGGSIDLSRSHCLSTNSSWQTANITSIVSHIFQLADLTTAVIRNTDYLGWRLLRQLYTQCLVQDQPCWSSSLCVKCSWIQIQWITLVPTWKLILLQTELTYKDHYCHKWNKPFDVISWLSNEESWCITINFDGRIRVD
jgi:hypothetical protein